MKLARLLSWGATLLCCLIATAAQAQMPDSNRSMMEHATEAATQPLKDINVKKGKIPIKLLAVQSAPYSIDGLGQCDALIQEVRELDAVLGPDVNEAAQKTKVEKRERGVSRIAGGIIGSFIPFRGVVRELTGANASQRRYLEAIYAGGIRRSFLKGVGLQMRCQKPGRP